MKKHLFIAPDNGILTLLFGHAAAALIRITNEEFFLSPVSRTFHGRDIIAPVGAHLTKGVELSKLGPVMNPGEAVRLDNLEARVHRNGEIVGKIIAIDHFGNLISNVALKQLTQFNQGRPATRLKIQIGSQVIQGLSETYGNVRSNMPLALVGSRGYLEIAVNCGSAARVLEARQGDTVRVII